MGAGFTAVLLLVVLMMAVGVWSLERTTSGMRAMMELPLQKERLVDDWNSKVRIGATRNAAIVMSDDDAYSKAQMADAKQASVDVGVLSDKIFALASSAEEKALLQRVGERRKSYNAAKNAMMKAKEEGRSDEAKQIYRTAFVKEVPVYFASVQELIDFEHRELEKAAAAVDADAARSVWVLGLVCAAAIGVGAAMAWLLTVSITRRLARTVELAHAVADGDLTHSLNAEGADEIAALNRALGRMSERLHGVLVEVQRSSDNIQTASAEVAVGNQDLSARTEQAAGHLQKTASSMEALTDAVKLTSESASQASTLALSAADVADRGGAMVQKVVSTMQQISAASHSITEIIGTIDGIAFQTNILALNAAVEAARAGEQGRGFAVVAAEVRTLAQRSASAAREIKQLINTSVVTVESGSRLVAEAGATMGDMVGSVRRVTDIIGEISAAASEQSQGIGQVSRAVNELDRMTQQNSALVEESAAAAESLKDQSRRLAQVLGGFTLNAAR